MISINHAALALAETSFGAFGLQLEAGGRRLSTPNLVTRFVTHA
jgi:hypothetical protein